MPFYGRINSAIPCQWNHWTSGLIRKERKAGSQVYQSGFWNEECPTQAFCSFGYDTHVFTDVAAGTAYEINIEACNDFEFVDVHLSFADNGDNNYTLYGEDIFDGSMDNIGSFTFTPTEPPGCNQDFDCATDYMLPNIALKPAENGYQGIDFCDTNTSALGYFFPIKNDNEYQFEINVCYNKQMQRWWFHLDNDHSFLINYIKTICEDNVPEGKELINNYLDFPLEYECEEIMKDLNALYTYGGIHHYGLREIIEAHEEQHKSDFEILLNNFKDNLNSKLLEDQKTCEDFSTQEEAQEYMENRLNLLWERFKRNLFREWNVFTGDTEIKLLEYENKTQQAIYHKIELQTLLIQIFRGCQDLILINP
jgi:hypothetical protein